MEENKKSYKKLPLILTIATCLVCCTVFTVLCAIGLIPIPAGNGKFYDLETASAVKNSYQVEDEATLRKLLLLNEELDIVVTKDIEISDPLLVKGTKTLYGDATFFTDISGEFKTMFMVDVQVGASLTWDGPTLDSDGSCDGININQKAELNIKSGTIQYVRDAVYSNGTVTMTGGLIQHASQNGIIASFRSKVYLSGGILYNGGSKLLNVETNGYAEVTDGVTFKKSRSDAIFNAGELNVYGGTICDTTGYGINTEGKLNIEYKGEKKDGYIEMNNIGTIAVRMTSSEDCYVSDVHAVNVGTNGLYTTDLRSNGKTTVENCIFDTCAINDGAAISISRKVVIKDVQILNSQGGGISCRTYGNLKIDGLVIDGTKTAGFSINDKFEGKNITISNVELYNVALKGEAEATFTDCVFGKSKRNSVLCTKNTTLNLENVQIEGVVDENVVAVQCSEGSTLNMLGDDNVISGSTAVGVCLLKDATLNMEGGKICDNHGKATGAGVWIRKEGAIFNMRGGTICNNTTSTSSGAVFVADKATFNMYGGTITGNKAELSGGAIGVQGVMNMSGGTISDNYTKTTGGGIILGNNTKKEIYGTINMTGGTIKNNEAGTNGGGINVSAKTIANISGGTIKDNKADGIGDGIADNGNLTISKNVCITGNDVGLVSRDVVMKIAGNSLSKHNAGNPLVVTPHFKTEPNKYVVIECDNESAAASMVNQYVKSGSKAYTLLQKEDKKSQITVNVNEIVMDLDTTGAETVYVTNFKQLKEAVQTTKTKRNIVLGADITMESLITVPAGTVVKIRDDGHTRTLSRNEKHTALFFETWYGTGLVLEGTSEGKLVLEGKTSGEAILKNVNSLVRVRGTSEFKNVAFQNNGNATVTISGAFIRNEYGYATVADCSFTNGTSKYGGAIYSKGDKLTVTDSTFTNNTATERGGAIGISKTTTVVENTTFKNNVAAGSGGAVYNASSGNLTLKGTSSDAIFEGNTVLGTLAADNYGGGALCAASGNVTITGYTFKDNTATNSNGGAVQLNSSSVVASITDCAFTGNKTVDTNTTDKITYGGGAILSKSKTTIADSVFTANTASDLGGAICMAYGELDVDACTFDANTAVEGGAIRTANKDIATTISNSVFTNNTASTYGGAICNYGTKGLTIADCTFGGEGNGNKADNNGGAIYHANGGKITLTDNNAKVAAIFQDNKSDGNGGAICIGSGTLAVTGYDFIGNNANRGGAVRINGTGINATFGGSVFKKNTAAINGGAISNASTKVYEDEGKAAVTISDCTFGNTNEGNSSKDGGAIYSETSKVKLNGTNKDTEVFKANEATGYGGAICISSGNLNVTGYDFIGNNAKKGGAVRLHNNAEVATFEGSVFEKNTATEYGGAINNASKYTEEDKAAVTITDCTFGGEGTEQEPDALANKAGLNGGAIFNATSKVALNGTKKATEVFKANEATGDGGAIYVLSGTVDVSGYQLVNNKAANGGAIAVGSTTTAGILRSSNCTFDGNQVATNGGAIHMALGTLDADDCTFNDNDAKQGGAINAADAQVTTTIDNSVFTNNTALTYGGAICDFGKNGIIITNCQFGELDDNNQAVNGNIATSAGGAIFHTRTATIKLIDTDDAVPAIFAGNEAASGGAICIGNGNLEVTGYDFVGNNAKNGGAVRLNGYDIGATFDGSVFKRNTASENGGAINTASTKTAENGYGLSVINCMFGGTDDQGNSLGNSATGRGGAIHSVGKSIQVSGTTFANNTAKYGGAINNEGSTIKATNCDFTSNQSSATYNKADETGRGGGAVNIVANSDATFDGTGTFTSNSTNAWGGAIYMTDSQLNISGYTFDQNKASFGGAILVDNVSDDTVETTEVTIAGSVFTRNSSTNSGGAAYVNGRKVTFTDCKFGGTDEQGISLGNSSKEYGGVIVLNNDADVKFVGTDQAKAIMEGNTATNYGGAIYVSDGLLNVSGYKFIKNHSDAIGGAICTTSADKNDDGYSTTVTNCIFGAEMSADAQDPYELGNYGTSGGAIYVGASSAVKISGSQFIRNSTTTSHGGAINASSGTLRLYDTTFAYNRSAGYGGALYSKNGTVYGEECSFDSNILTGNGYGYAASFEGGTVEFKLSDFSCNIQTSGKAILAKNVTVKMDESSYASLNGSFVKSSNGDVVVP